jgi:D-hydroxyproline dehydrogenase
VVAAGGTVVARPQGIVYGPRMAGQNTVAVIGAGIVGSAVAYALSREGRRVLLFDRGEPGLCGASFGNAGHIAAESVEPLPSVELLFGFWRQLFAFGGPLDIPLTRVPALAPWAMRFASAALRRRTNTDRLAPLVRASPSVLGAWLTELGRPQLFRTAGHYEVWRGAGATRRAERQAAVMRRLDIETERLPPERLEGIRVPPGAPVRSTGSTANAANAASAGTAEVAGLWYPSTGHVVDPLQVVRTFSEAARDRGCEVRCAEVRAVEQCGAGLHVLTEIETAHVDAVVVCAGPWSAALLEPFGVRVPLESVRGYHVELPQHAPLFDSSVLYADHYLVVTPMSGRLRATSYMEFEPPHAPPDPRKPAHLRRLLQGLGYRCEADGPSWMGSRPVLPDYLPGIGRVAIPARLFYAVGHHHIGLTTAAVTGELVADLIAEREPRLDVRGFDLRRFGARPRAGSMPARPCEAAR